MTEILFLRGGCPNGRWRLVLNARWFDERRRTSFPNSTQLVGAVVYPCSLWDPLKAGFASENIAASRVAGDGCGAIHLWNQSIRRPNVCQPVS